MSYSFQQQSCFSFSCIFFVGIGSQRKKKSVLLCKERLAIVRNIQYDRANFLGVCTQTFWVFGWFTQRKKRSYVSKGNYIWYLTIVQSNLSVHFLTQPLPYLEKKPIHFANSKACLLLEVMRRKNWGAPASPAGHAKT